MNFFQHVFSWFRKDDDIKTATRDEPRRPQLRDWTDALVANVDLTRGLYHNSYPGMKLAGGLAYAPIIVPVWFMGLPVPEPVDEGDDATAEDLQLLVDTFARDMKQIHIRAHRDGTCWIWPHYDAQTRELVWEFIPDETITDIFRDLNTGRIVKLVTHEKIKVVTAINKTDYIERRRTFTETRVEVEYIAGSGLLPSEFVSSAGTNVSGVLPIPFSNNSDGEEVRGHSDYERIIVDLKDYHDIDLKLSTMLAKFNIKMVQEVLNVDGWKKNNSVNSLNELHVDQVDLIFNLSGKEKTDFIFPAGAFVAYEERLKTKFKKIVEASMIPELAWGIKVEGNLASAEKQVEALVMYVGEKRDQATESYKKLFQASLRLLNVAYMRGTAPAIKVTWNKLDAISEQTKATIFQTFAGGVSSLINCAGSSKEQLFALWKQFYPTITRQDFEEWSKALSDMAQFKQFQNAGYTEVFDLQNGIREKPALGKGQDPKDLPGPGAKGEDEDVPTDEEVRDVEGPEGSTS